MFRYHKLLGRMKEMGLSQYQLAQVIGMSESTLNVKLNCKSYFKQNEIVRICDALDIDDCEVNSYFFSL